MEPVKLADKWRPRFLAEVSGQPEIAKVQAFVRNPYPSCWLFEGGAGVGKTSAAYAMAAELGCLDDFSGLHTVSADEFGVAEARKMFDHTLRFRPFDGNGWRLLLIEELEYLSPQCCRRLKVALEQDFPPRTVVVATSNDTSLLPVALRERFTVLYFENGEEFGQAAQDTVFQIWEAETQGAVLPLEAPAWGWNHDYSYSFRVALDQMQQHLLMQAVAEKRTGLSAA